MYAFFFEDNWEFITTADKAHNALVLGRLLSRDKERVVACIFNNGDGTTQLCWRFQSGQQIGLTGRSDGQIDGDVPTPPRQVGDNFIPTRPETPGEQEEKIG